jgi:REP element-mobilizing transposase RayT
LGDQAFVAEMQQRIGKEKDDLNIPKQQKRPIAKPLAEIAAQHKDRKTAIIAAYKTGAYSQQHGVRSRIKKNKYILHAMTRPLRLEFPNTLYYVTSRGDRREAIFEDDDDRVRFLEILGTVVADYNWLCHGYCLMDNHYHLIIETLDGNLSKGMRQLNGVYTQASNRRHGRVPVIFFKGDTKQSWWIRIAICSSFPAMSF